MFMANKRFPKLNPNNAEAFWRPDKKHKRAKLVVDFMVVQRIGLLAGMQKCGGSGALEYFDTIVGYSIETSSLNISKSGWNKSQGAENTV